MVCLLYSDDLLQVFFVQACQSHTNLDPAAVHTSSQSHSHIVLRRPHTLLISASVLGGIARRNDFGGLLADEFRGLDGETDICNVYTRAVTKMRKREGYFDQQPLLMSTLNRKLILPPNQTDGNISKKDMFKLWSAVRGMLSYHSQQPFEN